MYTAASRLELERSGARRLSSADAGDKQIAEDGEEAAIADEERRQIEAFGKAFELRTRSLTTTILYG